MDITCITFTQGFARELAEEVQALGFQSDVIDLKDYDPEDKLSDEVSEPAT